MRHLVRGFSIALGWYLALSFSRFPDDPLVNAITVVVATFGVALVALAAYRSGLDDGKVAR